MVSSRVDCSEISNEAIVHVVSFNSRWYIHYMH
jgi:hypothetical protein